MTKTSNSQLAHQINCSNKSFKIAYSDILKLVKSSNLTGLFSYVRFNCWPTCEFTKCQRKVPFIELTYANAA